MLLEVGIQTQEDFVVIVQDLDQLGLAHLPTVLGGFLQLSVLLAQAFPELGHFHVQVVLEGFELAGDDSVDFVDEFQLLLLHGLLLLEQDLAELLRQLLKVFLGLSFLFIDALLESFEIVVKILDFAGDFSDLTGFGAKDGDWVLLEELEPQIGGLVILVFGGRFIFLLHFLQVLGHALLANGLVLTHVQDGLREVLQTQIGRHHGLLLGQHLLLDVRLCGRGLHLSSIRRP